MIPYSNIKRQYKNLREEILHVTDEVLSSGNLMDAQFTSEFEDWLAKKNHSDYAVTCSSGTVALEIIAKYAKMLIWDASHLKEPTIVVPSITFSATANAFANTGWDLSFADVDEYGLINLNSIAKDAPYYITILVGLYGSTVEHIKPPHGKDFIIEDAAQHWLSDNCIRNGIASAISFDPTKNFGNYANGGAIITNIEDFASSAREYRNNGKPWHCQSGSNLRMSEVDCAQLMVKTQYIDEWQQRRKHIFKYWMEEFEKKGIDVLIDKKYFDKHAYHKFVISCGKRDTVRQRLYELGIETKIHYETPLFEYDVFQRHPNPGMLSAATMLSRSVLSLPCYPELTDSEVEYIAKSVIESI